MLNFESENGVRFCDGLTRRDFLKAGALSAGAVGLSLADLCALGAAENKDVNCILLFLVGGPSQLDTWDLKPDAPSNVRGPFRPIRTNAPGVEICEHFPLMAQMADRYAVLRSVHHTAAPIHETGHQLMQTGRLFRGQEYPHYGSVISHLRGPRDDGVPPFVVMPAPIGNTGVTVSHGQTAGYLGADHEPVFLRGDPARLQSRTELVDAVDSAHRAFDAARRGRGQETTPQQGAHRAFDADLLGRGLLTTPLRQDADKGFPPLGRGLLTTPHQDADKGFSALFSTKTKQAFDVAAEPEGLRSRYGRNTFGQSCLLARRLVEHGVRLVTVNMFDTVFNEVTWDCHADGGSLAVRLDDYKETLCPMFDRAYTTLLEDLKHRGMLDTTLVLAMGEFGRTPQLNPRGGRDHWPGCWSVLFAGAGVRGGQVVGASDKIGGEPKDRPVTPAEVAASVYYGLGVDLNTRLPGPENRAMSIADAAPVMELFRG